MSLQDRIEEEMVVSTESILEDQFDRANELFDIFEDNTVAITEKYSEVDAKEQILIYLIAQQYLEEADRTDSSALPNEYFYERIDKDDSTIRHYCGDLEDEKLLRTTEEGERELVVEQMPAAIDRITESE
jgi:hypothetical protein